MSSFSRVFPLKNSALWKGLGLGVLVCVVALAAIVFPTSVGYKRAAHFSRPGGGGGGDVIDARLESADTYTAYADGPRIIRKAQLELQVSSCSETQKKIEALAVTESGFLESSTLQENSAEIKLRVPSDRFDAVRAKLKELALRVRQDSVTATDVSKQYIDLEARLRNKRAEEQQFLEIMKKAHAVEDVLSVTKELTEVRGEIEREDAEFRHLKDQIDMAEIDVMLTSQAAAGVHWNFGQSTKSAFSDLLESLADFADFLIWLVVNLPLIALWTMTIFLLVAAAWYVLRKAWRIMRGIFGKKSTAAPDAVKS